MCDMNERMPGLFFLPGEVGLKDLFDKHKVALDLAKKRQLEFFRALVEAADTMWARTNGNPLSVSDQMHMEQNQNRSYLE